MASDVQMLKEQALDANLDGNPDGGTYSVADITSGALPGRAIRYRITVRNNGSSAVSNVTVYDSTPAFTTYTSTNPGSRRWRFRAERCHCPGDGSDRILPVQRRDAESRRAGHRNLWRQIDQ